MIIHGLLTENALRHDGDFGNPGREEAIKQL
jgi:hypothetical protein